MTRWSSLVAVLIFNSSLSAFAKVKFHCYGNPHMPVLAYQMGSINCPKGTSKGNTNSTQTVFCVHSALCEPLADGEKPTSLTEDDVRSLSMNVMELAKSSYKMASVSCAGTGQLVEANHLFGDCPKLESCAGDIAFNGSAASINGVMGLPSASNSVTVDSPSLEKGSAK